MNDDDDRPTDSERVSYLRWMADRQRNLADEYDRQANQIEARNKRPSTFKET